MEVITDPTQLPDTYLGHPRVDTAAPSTLPEIRIDESQKKPGMVPVNHGPIFNRRYSTAGWTPETIGRVVVPPEWNEYYLVEWHQGQIPHPMTLVKDFEPEPKMMK